MIADQVKLAEKISISLHKLLEELQSKITELEQKSSK